MINLCLKVIFFLPYLRAASVNIQKTNNICYFVIKNKMLFLSFTSG